MLKAPIVVMALLGLCMAAWAGNSGTKHPKVPDLAAFARTLEALRLTHRIPGLSAVVVKDEKVIFARGFGFANLERRVRTTPDTPFNIASVAKPISAAVALKLVELRRLDIDQPMSRYEGFSEFCEEFSKQESIFARDLRCGRLTMRHLLSHTVNGAPGEAFSYNPAMYSWTSRPMAQVAGKPFSSLVEEIVFRPAGMKNSARRHRDLPLPPGLAAALASPYHTRGDGLLVPSEPPPAQGDGAAGGVVATAMDLARFDIALDEGTLISRRSRELMMTPSRSTQGKVLPYGLGWFVQDFRGLRLVWHSGWWEKAYSALYLKVPEERLTLILLANSEGIWWDNPRDKAEVEKSRFAVAFLDLFVAHGLSERDSASRRR
jgi:CubicO group peptidase (beta-lactamase class C family)